MTEEITRATAADAGCWIAGHRPRTPLNQLPESRFTMPTIAEHTAYGLAVLADCSSPNGQASPGALFLLRLVSDAQEILDHNPGSDDMNDLQDAAQEVADSAVPIYTHELWSVFVDLGAYTEDLDEVGGASNDMEQNARACLYLIAERLVSALLIEAFEADDDDDDDDG